MIKTLKKEVQLCDNCEKESRWGYFTGCLSCRKEYCHECREKLGTDFPHGVSFSGSGDGYFCFPCQAKPSPATAELLRSYIVIQALRQESKNLWQDFDKRQKAAEEKVKNLRSKFS